MSDDRDTASFRLMQHECPVAEVSGPTLRAWAEICHYASVYGQDGPCYIQALVDGEWKVVAA